MVNHCANPACHKTLHYLRDGKVFLFSRNNNQTANSKLPQRLEHFWLCGICAKKWTLTLEGSDSLLLTELKRRQRRTTFSASLAPAS